MAPMFLKAGALSLALLLASRLLGLVRESAQAAAFGTTGLADAAVLMLTLPDWLTGVLASGALAYVLLPHWAGQSPEQQAATQRRGARGLIVLGLVLAALLAWQRDAVLQALAPGLSPALRVAASQGLLWSAVAVPAALLAALWTTRLQHERDFTGMYGANLVVNAVVVLAILLIAYYDHSTGTLALLGMGLVAAMTLRLVWLALRLPQPARNREMATAVPAGWPAVPVWAWAVLAAGLPLALPFAARSVASQAGEGALATFNYAWKLVELPLVLAIQLVASLAFPAITRALAGRDDAAHAVQGDEAARAVRGAFALAWTLACACAAGLIVAAPAVAQLLFGWGRMSPAAITQVAQWGAVGAWGLLPQALIAVALTVLAARGRMHAAVLAYAVALALLLAAGAAGVHDGARLMLLLNALLAGVAVVCVLALGAPARAWLPWRAMGASLGGLLVVALLQMGGSTLILMLNWPVVLAVGSFVAILLIAFTWWVAPDLRAALRR